MVFLQNAVLEVIGSCQSALLVVMTGDAISHTTRQRVVQVARCGTQVPLRNDALLAIRPIVSPSATMRL